jgi:hypothetical protein
MASTFITRTPSSNGATTKATWSIWVKRGKTDASEQLYFASSDSNNKMIFRFNSDATIDVRNKVSGSFPLDIETNRKFRDPSAWYHIVVAIDTTQATSSDRFKMYVNGVQETSFSTETYPSQNTDLTFSNTDDQMWIGAESGTGDYFSGSLAHFHYTDGYTYAATDFGETDSTSGIWKPKASPTGISYGTNGFFLKFENSGNLDLDSSGNNLSFTTSGTLTQNVDTPSNNFCVINPLDTYYFENNSFSNGNLTVSGNNSSFTFCTSTLGVSAGKWYIEAKLSAAASGGTRIGVVGRSSTALNEGIGDRQDEIAHQTNGDLKVNGTTTSSWGSTWTVGDIIGIALDLDNNKIYFSKNGTYQASGNPSTAANGVTITAADSTSTGVYRFGFGDNNSTGTSTFQYNFGSGFFGTTAVASANADGNGIGAFEYAVPTGYYAVCTKNIKEFG